MSGTTEVPNSARPGTAAPIAASATIGSTPNTCDTQKLSNPALAAQTLL